MKKLFVLLVLGLMLVFVTTSVFANFDYNQGNVTKTSGPSSTINLTAKVNQFASVTWICSDPPEKLVFTGYAGEKEQGGVTARVETNCPIWLKITGTPFQKTVGRKVYTLKSEFCSHDDFLGYLFDWHSFSGWDVAEPPKSLDLDKHDYQVDYRAELGAISDQPAGEYKGSLTATVYALYDDAI